MFWKRPTAALAAVCLMMSAAIAAAPPALETLLKRPLFYQMGISPDGKYLAATVPMGDDRTILAVLDRETLKVTATLQLPKDEHASSFVWANDERLLVMPSKKLGLLDRPAPHRRDLRHQRRWLQSKMLFGYRAQRDGLSKGNLVKQEWAGASVLHRSARRQERSADRRVSLARCRHRAARSAHHGRAHRPHQSRSRARRCRGRRS